MFRARTLAVALSAVAIVLTTLRLVFYTRGDAILWVQNLKLTGGMGAPTTHGEEYVAMCIAARNQHLDLPELLQHNYRHNGIRRFYIMDDSSDPPLSEADYGIPNEAITHRYFPAEGRAERMGNGNMQLYIYDSCQREFGSRHTWIANFDVDEFLEVKPPWTLESFLRRHEDAGGVAVNWIVYGSGGIVSRPSLGVRKSYTKCVPDILPDGKASVNAHIKTIARTAYYDHAREPHSIFTKNDSVVIGEDGEPVDGPFRRPSTHSILALHHYLLKSKEEFALKIERGSADNGRKDWNFFNVVDKEATEDCLSMTVYD